MQQARLCTASHSLASLLLVPLRVLQHFLQLAQRLIHKRLAQIFCYLAGTPGPQCLCMVTP